MPHRHAGHCAAAAVAGDAVQQYGDPGQARDDVSGAWPVATGAQAHLVIETVRDQVPLVQFGVLPAVRMFRGRPARRPQLTGRRVLRIQVGTRPT